MSTEKSLNNSTHAHAEASFVIHLLIKHARDEIVSILSWEIKAVGVFLQTFYDVAFWPYYSYR